MHKEATFRSLPLGKGQFSLRLTYSLNIMSKIHIFDDIFVPTNSKSKVIYTLVSF